MHQFRLPRALKNTYVQTAILGIIIIGGVFAFWYGLRFALRTELPLFAVATGSMVPTLNVGDLIVIQGYVDPSTIYAAPYPNGDIVVFQHWDPVLGLEHWVHRAVGTVTVGDKSFLRTKGDANSVTDIHYNITTHAVLPGLPREYVVGKVVGVVPWIGNVSLFLRTPTGTFLIVVLFIIVILAEYVPELLKKARSETKAL